LSDIYEGSYTIAQDPLILQNVLASATLDPGKNISLTLEKTQNTNPEKSLLNLSLSNTPLA
jgi:hypothetical protein